MQRVVTRIDPMAMLRVSLSFSLCLWLIIVVAGIVMWQAAVVTGSISKVEDFLAQLLAESAFTIDGFRVLQGSAILGFVLFVAGAAFSCIVSVLYNLIASVFGGLRADTIGTPEPQSGGDERSHADGDECPTDHLHRGASWNRTSDLTLIRGAL